MQILLSVMSPYFCILFEDHDLEFQFWMHFSFLDGDSYNDGDIDMDHSILSASIDVNPTTTSSRVKPNLDALLSMRNNKTQPLYR